MEYNVTSSNGAVSCTGPADSWDVCTDKTKMTFNYSTCATQMMYSSKEHSCFYTGVLFMLL
ncbi:hypothetical protein DPMN_190459 [Dreissena polymorpha]|uniref:Uncharacterized protein n=1 Tax=Dreissena polymorpha TaxID=45954 RepID=A0A9D4DW86_DREPO|nr:hypothetical protein DPMN_190459 [Dreissena polymorpha]